MEHCEICGSDSFKTNPNKQEYEYCTFCNTNVKKDLTTTFTYELYSDINIEAEKKTMRNDKKHYNSLRSLMNTKNAFASALGTVHFNTIYAFGGGLPKLESFISHDKIIVYDACSEGYIKHIQNFNDIYEYKKSIEYQSYWYDLTGNFYTDILSKINQDTTDLLTFVHFLEHLTPELLVKTLNELFELKKYANNKTFLIYQPNVSLKKNGNWFHWRSEHLTLIPMMSYVALLKKIGFNILFSEPYSEDMLIIFN